MMWKRSCLCLLVAAVNLTTAASVLAAESAQDERRVNPFSPSALKGDLALWTAVVFLVLVAVLWKFAWGPLSAALDRREKGVADQIAEAEAANQKAKEILADYEKKLVAAKDDVRGILDQGRRDAEKLGRELLDKAKEEASAEHVRRTKADRGRRRRRREEPRRPERRDGGRSGRQDRRRQAKARRSRQADRAGRQWVYR